MKKKYFHYNLLYKVIDFIILWNKKKSRNHLNSFHHTTLLILLLSIF